MTITTSPNICLAYMYRDASNYKQHGEAIFSNESHLPLDEIEKQIRSLLNDGEFFIARQIHLEERFFDAHCDDDHPWHEFLRVETTNQPAFDPGHDHKRDIAEFLSDLDKARRAGWDEMNVRDDLARQFTEQKRALKQRLAVGVQSSNGEEHEDDLSSARPA